MSSKEVYFSDLRQSNKGRGYLVHFPHHHTSFLVGKEVVRIISSNNGGKANRLPMPDIHTSFFASH